jgi:hypothetical protein
MLGRLWDRVAFRLERWIQLGTPYQLLLIAALIGLVAVAGGLLVYGLQEGFSNPGEAIWWAFLRLTDPGYLGDDEGTLRRTVSTVVTVLGYVLFMGSLIAILTQGLQRTMRRLESGLTPIAMDDHVLILGWTNRTAAIVNELVRSEGRVRRFLRRHGTRLLRIVILAEEVDAALVQELRDELGDRWNERQVIIRTGSPLRMEDLRRVDLRNAAAVILPSGDFTVTRAEAMDTRIVKALMSISVQLDGVPPPRPSVVAEVFDAQKLPIAWQAYDGELDLIASDRLISRLLTQNVRHRGLSYVYNELLSYSVGSAVYVRSCPAFAGATVRDLQARFPKAILLGVARPEGVDFRAYLSEDVVLAPDDRLVMIAQSYKDGEPSSSTVPLATTVQRRPLPALRRPVRRLLVLGWSHKLGALLGAFGGYPGERFEVTVVSLVPVAEREAYLARGEGVPERVSVRHVAADFTAAPAMRGLAPEGYDNVILMSSDWLGTEEESDARTVMGYVLLQSLLPAEGPRPEVLVELMDPENASLFRQRAGEVIISPLVLSHMLAHMALRRELTCRSGRYRPRWRPGGRSRWACGWRPRRWPPRAVSTSTRRPAPAGPSAAPTR